jgi:predicted O-methyltransferase YrrM
MNVGFWVRHPRLIPHRVAYWLWERMNPGKPWLCQGTLRFLEGALRPSMTGVEFGSGRSTAWFARHLKRLASVEHHESWHDQVRSDLERQRVTNVDYRLVPLDHPEGEPERERYDPLPDYVAVLDGFPAESLDVLVVDGHYRTTCVKQGLDKLRPGGLLLVDDVNLWPSRQAIPVPDSWDLVDESTNGIKSACVWRKPEADGR